MKKPTLSPELLEKGSRFLFIAVATLTALILLLAILPDSAFQGLLEGFFPSARGKIYKLELQEFTHQRADGKFNLFVRVRNISRRPMENIQAVVSLYDISNRQLNTLVYPLETPTIEPFHSYEFSLSFTESTPVQRYTIYFQDEHGVTIPHQK